MSWRIATSILIATIAVVSRASAATPPAGFEDHTLVDGGSSSGAVGPDGIAYEPGSDALFILEKGNGSGSGSARVRRRNLTTGAVTTALTINCLDSLGERGLLGIAFDPDYLVGGSVNRYVYLYYTRAVSSGGCAVSGLPSGSYNSIVRYHEGGGILTGEQVLLRGPQLGADSHNGGTVRFALDKTIYVSMGDNSTGADPTPAARNMTDLRGKILRINRDGTIPSDNPFVGQAGVRPEIWAWGLRNPFRMHVDSATGNLVIADVGEDTWEEIDAGIAGADYGWPCYEAGLPRVACSPAPNGDVKPIYKYDHSLGNCVIGGPVYRASAFPAEYAGAYFFGDYVANWVKRGRFAADGTLIDVESFLTNATGVSDMAVSPAGCLTWVSNGLEVRETCYVGGTNGQPQAVATAAPTSGLAPLSVQFAGAASSDPDQDPLTYSWAFGDATSSSQASPLKTYNSNGVRMATLTVDDGTGSVNSTDAAPPIRIVVGNRSPVGTITTPAAGAHYSAGDTIAYAGTATDPEDGALPSSAYSWTVVFHHGAHTHPFLGPIVGTTSGSFTIPASGEEAVDVYYQLLLSVTDSGAPLGSVGKVTHDSHIDIVPNLTTVTVAAAPAGAGLQLAIDQIPGPAPQSIPSVVGFPRTITAPSPQTIGASTWAFVSWSDAGAAEHTLAAPPIATTYTATYQCTAGCAFAPSLTALRVSTETTRLQWGSLACATGYDVVRGSLSILRSGVGDFTAATQACVASDLAGMTVDDPTPTAAGGFWYLVRGIGCPGGPGTYDENGTASVAASRDAEIMAAAAACP